MRCPSLFYCFARDCISVSVLLCVKLSHIARSVWILVAVCRPHRWHCIAFRKSLGDSFYCFFFMAAWVFFALALIAAEPWRYTPHRCSWRFPRLPWSFKCLPVWVMSVLEDAILFYFLGNLIDILTFSFISKVPNEYLFIHLFVLKSKYN